MKLRYKRPGQEESIELSQPIARAAIQDNLATSSDDLRFAASVAGFGQLLQGGNVHRGLGLPGCPQLARDARGDDPTVTAVNLFI